MFMANMCGISEPAMKWFKDYLRDRVVQVLVRNSFSEAVSIPSSVPQGSFAGSVLCNMYFSNGQVNIGLPSQSSWLCR